MDKIKDYIGRLGEKLFPNLPEKKRNRITVQVIIGVAISFVCIVGMGVFRYLAVKQLEEMFLEFAKGDLKKQTHSRYYRAYVNYVKDSSFGKIPARKIKKYHCDDLSVP